MNKHSERWQEYMEQQRRKAALDNAGKRVLTNAEIALAAHLRLQEPKT